MIITQVVKYLLLSQYMIREGYTVSDLKGSFTVYLSIYIHMYLRIVLIPSVIRKEGRLRENKLSLWRIILIIFERHFPISNGLLQVSVTGVLFVVYVGYPFISHYWRYTPPRINV